MRKQKLPLFNFAWFRDFHQGLQELASLCSNEAWDYTTAPTGHFPILFNYIQQTFVRLKEQKRLRIEKDHMVFNTGLVTDNQEEIYAFFQKNVKKNSTLEWYFVGWRKQTDRCLGKFKKLPPVACYYTEPGELLYDQRLELLSNTEQLVADCKPKFPPSLLRMENYQLGNLLQGTIEDAKRRAMRDYKTAVPQFHKKKLQLLLPLCLQSKSKADLALVIEKDNNQYRSSTILPLPAAICNARIIARPDSEWLRF